MTVKSIAGAIRIATEIDEKNRKKVTGWQATWKTAWGGERVDRQYSHADFMSIIDDARYYGLAESAARIMSGQAKKNEKVTSVIAGYDIMYDLAPAWGDIVTRFGRVAPLAKSQSDIYSIRLFENEDDTVPCVVFWDLRHLTPRGIRGMAETLGIEDENDTHIILSYIDDCIKSHNLDDELGTSILTMTSLARHEASQTVGKLSYDGKNGRSHSLLGDYRATAAREQAKTYDAYAMRRACNRGGFVFTSACTAGRVQGRTISIDETSAHHAQVMCRWIPERFKEVPSRWIQGSAERIAAMTIDDVLESYHMPFKYYFHALFEFENVRLRRGSVWEQQEIGLESIARLADVVRVDGVDDEAAVAAEAGIREQGFRDEIEHGRYCLGKVMSASKLRTWMTEIELWNFSRVYEWDSMTVIRGEATGKRRRPDDYAILTSMRFFRGKQELKSRIRSAGDATIRAKLQARYDGEIKPQFNAVGYGLHARDEFKPRYMIDDNGTWTLQKPVSIDDYDERRPKHPQALYTYGSRISTGARMQLIIAAELIFREFGNAALILAGDTDSLKIRTDLDADEIIHALEPLHESMRCAISRVTARAYAMWIDDYDPMRGVGEFMLEDEFEYYYCPGVKQACGISRNGTIKLTLAGVPHTGERSYAAWLKQMVAKYGPRVLERVFTFDVRLAPDVSQLKIMDYSAISFDDDGTPIMPDAQRMYYTLNDTKQCESRHTVRYQREHGRQIELDVTALAYWSPAGAEFAYSEGVLRAYDTN